MPVVSGRRVRGSRTGRPIMVLLDLLGRRWALRILWELRDGPLTFRGLRERCDQVSPTVLNRRLAELREARIVARGEGEGYRLTPDGVQLGGVLMDLQAFADEWEGVLE